MNPDDWKVIERIFHDALDRPGSERPAFVESECSDPQIRAEVMKLLSRVSEDYSLELPGAGQAGDATAAPAAGALPGQLEGPAAEQGLIGVTLAHFTIVAYLGHGGMGVVYRAQDRKLHRMVALKVLPERTSTELSRRQRLVHEARAASALNHPNIVTIYEIGSDRDKHFIAMELISGKTVAEIVRSGPSAKEILRYAVQIADALECAHRANVIHRDLKPSNIMVTDSGQVKVLDFGLAKTAAPLAISDPATQTMSAGPVTQEGIIVGTVAYMSPEQAQGKPLDARSDIFSFGAVLYEMLTGECAFARDSAVSTLAAILREEPPPLGAHVAASIREIVWRCLRKTAGERWQNFADLRSALQAAYEEQPGERTRPLTDEGIPRRTPRWFVATLLAMAVAATGALLWNTRVGHSPAELVPVRLTSNPVDLPVEGLALSPDGRYLSYEDTNGVHLRGVETGDTRLLPGTKGMFVSSNGWSSDGTRLFIGNHGDSQPAFFSLPVFGGTMQAMGNELPLPLTGFSMAFSVARIQLKASDGSLYPFTHERGSMAGLAVGKKLIAFAFARADRSFSIEAFDVQKRRWTVLLPAQQEEIAGPAWISDTRLLYAQAEPPPRQKESNLWVLPVDPEKGAPSGAPERRTQWVDFSIAALSATADGQRICMLRGREEDQIFIGGLRPGGGQLAEPRRLTAEAANEQVWAWTPDSNAILYTSDRNGPDQLFRQEIDKNNAELIASGRGVLDFGQVSPDKRWLLFLSHERKQGHHESRMMKIPIEGGNAQELWAGSNLDSLQCSSAAAGSCILVETRGLTSIVSLFDVLKGRGPVVLETKLDAGGLSALDHPSSRGAISPDGMHIAVVLPGTQHNRIRIVGLDRTPEAEITVPGAGYLTSLQWMVDGGGFYCGDVSSENSSRLLQVHADGTSEVLWTTSGDTQMWAVPSPDGKYLAITKVTGSANVWMVEKP